MQRIEEEGKERNSKTLLVRWSKLRIRKRRDDIFNICRAANIISNPSTILTRIVMLKISVIVNEAASLHGQGYRIIQHVTT